MAGVKILFIGGTQFVGRAMALAAVRDGHEVTLLHRGKSGNDEVPGAEHLLADRDGDLNLLAEREWDATIDVCGYFPRQIRSLAEALDGRGGHHVYISSISAYAEPDQPDFDEDAALLEPAGDSETEITGGNYGKLKVACELAAAEAYGDNLTIIRPTYVVGPYDYTGRFPYWVRRIADGGEVLAPGPADAAMQLVDVRDLADFTVKCAAERIVGTFNGCRETMTFSDILEGIAVATGSDANLTWVDGDFLAANEVSPMQLPLWSGGDHAAALTASPARARTAGLRLRLVEETITDTLAWLKQPDAIILFPGGLEPDAEAKLLAAWHERT